MQDDRVIQIMAKSIKRMIADNVNHARENGIETDSEEETLKKLLAGESVPFYNDADSDSGKTGREDGGSFVPASGQELREHYCKKILDCPGLPKSVQENPTSMFNAIDKMVNLVGQGPGPMRGVLREIIEGSLMIGLDHVKADDKLVNLVFEYLEKRAQFDGERLAPDVFLCHSTKDHEFVKQLASDLSNKGYRVWYSEWEMKLGDSLYSKIQDAIQSSYWFLVVLSPEAVESTWCKRELHNALEHENSKKRVFVLPVLHRDCEIPGFLREKLYADCRGEHYPNGLKLIVSRLSSRDKME